eukprot:TRINITY_DN262_c0_g1_i3.p1 TRINITY_DN262_c0_g1~~TRINITY_DN262_c0_g1_i3.p1  ORF type:complete len:1777 (-),score=290.85 TRINITY_DN262_c0_g1_i3:876-5441(-)
MEMWDWVGACADWSSGWFGLLARAARDQAGHIDWEVHLQELFSRSLRLINVPVGSQPPPSVHQTKPPASCAVFGMRGGMLFVSMARLLVYTLKPKGKALLCLQQLLATLEDYYHPSNGGEWTGRLAQFLLTLCEGFADRIADELHARCNTPQSYRVTDDMISAFVEMILPVVTKSLYSKNQRLTLAAHQCVRLLASLRPRIVLPPLISRVFPALETLTETHQTLSALESLAVVAPALLRGEYAEGRTQLLSLLDLSLPGIDSNDIVKTMATLKFYCAVLCTVPLINATRYAPPAALDDFQERMRDSSAAFEDWSLQLLEKLFTLCVQRAAPSEQWSPEKMLEALAYRTAFLMFMQMDIDLYERASQRVLDFVQQSFLPDATKVVARLVGAVVSAQPAKGSSLFIPFAARHIVNGGLTDSELKWYVAILSNATRASGVWLQNHVGQLLGVLRKLLLVKTKSSIKSLCKLLRHTLRCSTQTYISEYRSVSTGLWGTSEFAGSSFLQWGKYPTVEQIAPEWHIPGTVEVQFAQRLFEEFLVPALEVLEAASRSDEAVNRTDVQGALLITRACLRGGASQLAGVGNHVGKAGFDSDDVDTEFRKRVPPATAITPDFVLRKRIGLACCAMIDRLLRRLEGDASTLVVAAKTLTMYIASVGITGTKLPLYARSYVASKMMLGDHLAPSIAVPRFLLLDRVFLLHLQRLFAAGHCLQRDETTDRVAETLLLLSLNQYSEVRKRAQDALAGLWRRLPSYKPGHFARLLTSLSSETSDESTVKGATYAILNRPMLQIAVKSWGSLGLLFRELMNSRVHDQPKLQARLHQVFVVTTLALQPLPIEVPLPPTEPSAVAVALDESVKCFDYEAANAIANQRMLTRRREFDLLFESLQNWLADRSLHWRYRLMAIGGIMLVLRPNVIVPARLTELLCDSVISDSAPERTAAVKALGLLLAVNKPVRPRSVVTASDERVAPCNVPQMGPSTPAEWEAMVLHDKDYHGWSASPAFPLYGPRIVPVISTTASRAAAEVIVAKFQQGGLISRLVGFLADEQRTGSSAFSETTAILFKGLAQTLELPFAAILLPLAAELVQSETDRGKHVTACEILAGCVRGTKHWSFSDLQAFYPLAAQVLNVALVKMPQDAVSDWCSAFRFIYADRDPRRLSWLTDILFKDPLAPATAAAQGRRLKFISQVMSQQAWRCAPRALSLLDHLEPHIAHQFKQVREKIARCLAVAMRVLWINGIETNDRIATLCTRVAHRLNAGIAHGWTSADEAVEAQEFIRFRRTVLTWISNCCHSGYTHTAAPFVLPLLPGLLQAHDDPDREIVAQARVCCGYVAQVVFQTQVQPLLNAVVAAAASASWRVRMATLVFIQLSGYNHAFLFDAVAKGQMMDVVQRLLYDQQVEVRELASVTLSGFVKMSDDVLRQKLVRKFVQLQRTPAEGATKHGNVLGLGALARASPYEVPDWLPVVLEALARHATDPPPIAGSIRLVFNDFWRTHRDMWFEHKTKFNDDQLVILTDLLVSPSYYA